MYEKDLKSLLEENGRLRLENIILRKKFLSSEEDHEKTRKLKEKYEQIALELQQKIPGLDRKVDELQKENEKLHKENSELVRKIESLIKSNESLTTTVFEQGEKLEDHEKQLKKLFSIIEEKWKC